MLSQHTKPKAAHAIDWNKFVILYLALKKNKQKITFKNWVADNWFESSYYKGVKEYMFTVI